MVYAVMVGIIVVCLVLEGHRDELPAWLPFALLGLLLAVALMGGFTWGYHNLGPILDARF